MMRILSWLFICVACSLFYCCSGKAGTGGSHAPSKDSIYQANMQASYQMELNKAIRDLKTELSADSIIQNFIYTGYDDNHVYTYDYVVNILGKNFADVQDFRVEELGNIAKERLRKVILGVRNVGHMNISIDGFSDTVYKFNYCRYDSFKTKQ